MKAFCASVALGALAFAGRANAATALVDAFPGSTGTGATLTAVGAGVISSVASRGAGGSSLTLHNASGSTVLASGIAGRTSEAFALGNGRAIVSFVEAGVSVLPSLRVRKTFWSTDGTLAGTFPLPLAAAEGTSGTQGTSVQVVDGGAVLSGVPTETGTWEAWWSDGTVDGTHRVGVMCAESLGLTAVGTSGSRAYVSGIGCETSNGALYVVERDGLSVLDFGSFSSQVAAWNAVGSSIFFDVSDGTTWQWWRGDGASPPMAAAGSHVARHYASTWRLGTEAFAATSSAVVAVDSGDSVVAPIAGASLLGIAGGRMIFAGGSGDSRALWSSDGTPTGTWSLGPVVDPASFAAPRPLVEYSAVGTLPSSVLFFANVRGTGNLPSRDRELWATDGTQAGTHQVFATIGGPALQPSPVMLGGASFFLFDGDVWRSDGTPAGTALIAATSGQSVILASAAETVYMLVEAPSGGSVLWAWTAETLPPSDGGVADAGGLDGGSDSDAGGGGEHSPDGGSLVDAAASREHAASLPTSATPSTSAASSDAGAASRPDDAANPGAFGCSLSLSSAGRLDARLPLRSEEAGGILLVGLVAILRRRARTNSEKAVRS